MGLVVPLNLVKSGISNLAGRGWFGKKQRSENLVEGQAFGPCIALRASSRCLIFKFIIGSMPPGELGMTGKVELGMTGKVGKEELGMTGKEGLGMTGKGTAPVF